MGEGTRIAPEAIFVAIEGKSAIIGRRCKIDAGAVIYAGVSIGNDAIVGHHAVIRTGATIGSHTIISNLVMIEGNTRIGSHVNITAQCHITQFSHIEDYVFLGPMVVTTNDRRMAYRRKGHGENLRGATMKYGARIGANATLLPAITIGREAIVGAGAVVTNDVPDFATVYGVPARVMGRAKEDGLILCQKDHD